MKQQQCDLVTQTETDRVTIQELMLQTERGKEKIIGLEKALSKAEDTVTALTDKNLFLVQEKAKQAAFLAQYDRTE